MDTAELREALEQNDGEFDAIFDNDGEAEELVDALLTNEAEVLKL